MKPTIAWLALVVFASGCKTTDDSSRIKSDDSAPAADDQPGSPADTGSADVVAAYRAVVSSYPVLFAQQVQGNQLDGAKTTARTMYLTLEALEGSPQVASQVCAGDTQFACGDFRGAKASDIKNLYLNFVMGTSLSSANLQLIATRFTSGLE